MLNRKIANNGQCIKLKDLPLEIRKEISDIYKEDKSKIMQTVDITKTYYRSLQEKGELLCFGCHKVITEDDYKVHAEIHAVTSNPVYWKKENLKPIHNDACHDLVLIERYELASGELIVFDKSMQEAPYRDYLNDPNFR